MAIIAIDPEVYAALHELSRFAELGEPTVGAEYAIVIQQTVTGKDTVNPLLKTVTVHSYNKRTKHIELEKPYGGLLFGRFDNGILSNMHDENNQVDVYLLDLCYVVLKKLIGLHVLTKFFHEWTVDCEVHLSKFSSLSSGTDFNDKMLYKCQRIITMKETILEVIRNINTYPYPYPDNPEDDGLPADDLP